MGSHAIPAGHRLWGSIVCPEPPPCYFQHEDMLRRAQAMLAGRETRFPEMVRSGELASDEAEAELATFRALVADLEWIVSTYTGAETGPIPINQNQRVAICAALDTVIADLSADLVECGNPIPIKLSNIAHDVIALRWSFDPERGRLGLNDMHSTAMLNGQMRRNNQISQKRKATA